MRTRELKENQLDLCSNFLLGNEISIIQLIEI